MINFSELPRCWSVFQRELRTDNDAEGCHNRLNKKAKGDSLSLYRLIDVLYQEASTVDYTMRCVKLGRTSRRQRSRTVYINKQIASLEAKLKQGELRASRFLELAAEINGPTASMRRRRNQRVPRNLRVKSTKRTVINL